MEVKTTDTAEQFMAANKLSPVVYGAILDQETGGAHYRLDNGKSFTLSCEECRKVPKTIWLGEA